MFDCHIASSKLLYRTPDCTSPARSRRVLRGWSSAGALLIETQQDWFFTGGPSHTLGYKMRPTPTARLSKARQSCHTRMATQPASPEIEAEAPLCGQRPEVEGARRTRSQGKDGSMAEGGDSDCVCIEVVDLDASEDADDEADHIHAGCAEAMKKPERDQSSHEQLGGAKPACASLQNWPRGRLWFHHVEIIRKGSTLTDGPASASRRLTLQIPAPRLGLRQSHLDTFLCGPDLSATAVTAAQKSTALPIRTPRQQPKRRSLRPQKPRIDLSDDSLSSALGRSSGSAQSEIEQNTGSEGGSNFSSEDENDSSSDAISAAGTSTTNITENTTDGSDSIPRRAPKRNPDQRIRTAKAQSSKRPQPWMTLPLMFAMWTRSHTSAVSTLAFHRCTV